MSRHTNRTLIGRAKLVGAYRRHDPATYGRDTVPADERVAELENRLPADAIADARRIAEAPEHNQS